MKTYQTKTGVQLTVIQGLGQGDGIARGILKLVSGGTYDHAEAMRRDEAKRINAVRSFFKLKSQELYHHLTLKQMSQCIGDAYMDYKAKALQAKRVSKSRKVHAIADEIIAHYDQFVAS